MIITDAMIDDPSFNVKRYVDRELARTVLLRLVEEEKVEWNDERTERVLAWVEQGASLIDAYDQELIMNGRGGQWLDKQLKGMLEDNR
jgi:hypothetical protein